MDKEYWQNLADSNPNLRYPDYTLNIEPDKRSATNEVKVTTFIPVAFNKLLPYRAKYNFPYSADYVEVLKRIREKYEKEIKEVFKSPRYFKHTTVIENHNMENREIINMLEAEKPKYESSGAAGFDLKYDNVKAIYQGQEKSDATDYASKAILVLSPGTRVLIGTGLTMEIPKGFELQVRSRSGLALKKGLMVANSPGTVDSKPN